MVKLNVALPGIGPGLRGYKNLVFHLTRTRPTRSLELVGLCGLQTANNQLFLLAIKLNNVLNLRDCYEFLSENNIKYVIPADAITGYRPKDEETNTFDLRAAKLVPRLIQEKPPAAESIDLLEDFMDVSDDPVGPTIHDRLMELKKEQKERKERRIQQRGVDTAKTKKNLANWAETQEQYQKQIEAKKAAAAAMNPNKMVTAVGNDKTAPKKGNLKVPRPGNKKPSGQRITILPPNMRTVVPTIKPAGPKK